MLTASEAQQIAERFLKAKYFGARINFKASQLTVQGAGQVYRIEGRITMRSFGRLDRFIVGKWAHTYDFRIEVDAQRGQVLRYELV